jgi:hypothetical protein
MDCIVEVNEGLEIGESVSDPVLIEFRDACVTFFLEASRGKVYHRRPPLALRLPHDDFVIVVKPTTTHCHDDVMVDDRGIVIEVLRRCPDAVGNKFPVKMLRVMVEETARPKMWRLRGEGIRAAKALIEMAKDFLNAPRSVIERNKDNCCCCGKSLRDETSRARGVGPECLTKMGVFFSWGAFQQADE